MLYIFSALYCEAQAIIKYFHLEKETQSVHFQEFYNESLGIRLTVTGVGEIAAAVSVGSICAAHRPGREDMLLNIGTCAHRTKRGEIYLCNKIIEQATGKTFYPDVLYRHDFCEEAVVTGMLAWNDKKDNPMMADAGCDANIYDMEAAAIYQAGSYFFGPHQMAFLKVASDSGGAEGVCEKQVRQLMEEHQNMIFSFIEQLLVISHGKESKKLCRNEEAVIERLCADMHCSQVMRDSLKNHIHYMELAKMEYMPVIQRMYEEGLIPCKDKREGKVRFEELKRRLF